MSDEGWVDRPDGGGLWCAAREGSVMLWAVRSDKCIAVRADDGTACMMPTGPVPGQLWRRYVPGEPVPAPPPRKAEPMEVVDWPDASGWWQYMHGDLWNRALRIGVQDGRLCDEGGSISPIFPAATRWRRLPDDVSAVLATPWGER